MTAANNTPLIALQTEAPLADGKSWVHLLPAGVFTGIDGRGPYDATYPEGIVLNSRDYAGQRQMVIDYEHGSDRAKAPGNPIPAAGWVVGMQGRNDGVWGLVEWTDRAKAMLVSREYRYLSPVIRHDAAGKVIAILRASLTNLPNLDQLTALASAEETDMDEFTTKLCELLALPADSAKDVIISALAEKLTSLNAAADPDPAKFVPIGQFQRAVAEANKLRQGVSKQAAEDRVDEVIRKGVMLPWMRDWGVSLCMANAPSFEEFVTGCGPGFTTLLSRTHTTRVPTDRTSPAVDATVVLVATQLGLNVATFGEQLKKSGQERA